MSTFDKAINDIVVDLQKNPDANGRRIALLVLWDVGGYPALGALRKARTDDPDEELRALARRLATAAPMRVGNATEAPASFLALADHWIGVADMLTTQDTSAGASLQAQGLYLRAEKLQALAQTLS